jgi:hypothetical protein
MLSAAIEQNMMYWSRFVAHYLAYVQATSNILYYGNLKLHNSDKFHAYKSF